MRQGRVKRLMFAWRVRTVAACLLFGSVLVIVIVDAARLAARSAPQQLRSLLEQIASTPMTVEQHLDGCVRLHHLWKAQLLALDRPSAEREVAFRDTVFSPNTAFWAGYLGDEAAFTKWTRSMKPLAEDPRVGVPISSRIGPTIVETTRRMEQLTRRRACGDWFVVYGPGWTNMGGLGNARMVVDILGLPMSDSTTDLRFALPHELNHLVFDQKRDAQQRGTLLYRMIDEGFASFVADEYWGAGLSPAEALGYTSDEWDWAVAHEGELWAEARRQILSTDRQVLDTFSSASRRVIPGAPGKIGYFLGLRIVEDFVRRNGPQSWHRLYDMPLEAIVAATRFGSSGQAAMSRGTEIDPTSHGH